MRKIYHFSKFYGRIGSLDGIFIADEEEIKDAIGKIVDFGEALGKHSNISFILDPYCLVAVSDDQDFIDKFKSYGCSVGYNPLHYLVHEDEEEETECL